jgi:formylglycine-generating enzyme required for sulfatase activity
LRGTGIENFFKEYGMKKLNGIFVFALVGLTVLAFLFTTCENEYVIALLRGPSELESLEIDTYNAEGGKLQGGASLVPGFSPALYDYTVYIPYEAVFFVINAGVRGEGTVTWISEGEKDGNAFTLPADMEARLVTVRGERDYMDIADYQLTVMRGPETPRGITLGVMPGIGAFFLKPVSDMPRIFVEVDATPPSDGGELSYQWFRNSDNNNRTGEKIQGATDKIYELTDEEKIFSGTVYYYAELTNNLNGQTNSMESMTRSVKFIDKQEIIDKGELDAKSIAMTDIPSGTVNVGNAWRTGAVSTYYPTPTPVPWSTPGFLMGTYEVTYELWKLVFDEAEIGGFSFANSGNQGAEKSDGLVTDTIVNPRPVGNKLNPVTMISWRDCAVWCNAYSEMDNLQAVYVDSNGNTLRDSRNAVEFETPNYANNGYRLPTVAEWEYAARGGNPGSTEWDYTYVGGNSPNDYYWYYKTTTQEVGLMQPNSIGLYDMGGNVNELVTLPDGKASAVGYGFDCYNNVSRPPDPFSASEFIIETLASDFKFTFSPGWGVSWVQGFRIMCAKD